MLARVDGTTVGLVSGGCLEADLAEHARRVHASGQAAVVTYDTRADDDAVWGLGLGCNGLVDVLLAPLPPAQAADAAALLARALGGEAPAVIATVVEAPDGPDAPAIGAQALVGTAPVGTAVVAGRWGDGRALAGCAAHAVDALAAGRRGLVRACAGALVAFEVVVPVPRLVVCGSGPDAAPVVRLAAPLGWDVTVVDHRASAHAHPERFPGARVVSCPDPLALAAALGDAVPLGRRTAAVVMSHHFARDASYVQALLASEVAYVGLLGPRTRTERVLAELAARGAAPGARAGARLHGPVGLDVGGDGPEAIALAIVAEASAALNGRGGGHLRERAAPLHADGEPAPAAARA
jgi:xanthine/CO dehydrogenase XdhC/CoxF family maturation factor